MPCLGKPKEGSGEQSLGTRRVKVGQSEEHAGLTNLISTTKYNFATFLPKFIFQQFSKYWNIYFLVIGLTQQIEGISPTGRWGTILPLLAILSVTALKEVLEDLKRKNQDGKINNRLVLRAKESIWEEVMWSDIKVGDVIKVMNKESFPADLVLLSSSGEKGISYIETSNLDGETNLKVRQSLTVSNGILGEGGKADRLAEMKGAQVDCEGPNKKLYDFNGSLSLASGQKTPLSTAQVLLRGSRLMNTDFAIGLVVYSGPQSKLMMNASKAPLKESSVQQVINIQIIYLFLFLLGISFISALCKSLESEDFWYIPQTEKLGFFWSFLTFVILYNNVIPISLQVTLEFVKVFQAMLVSYDKDMFYKNPNVKNDEGTWALARTSNLNEELGQIKYVFSDKTGTLTQNIMAFKYCGLDGVKYSETDKQRLKEDFTKEPLIKDFLTILSVCHTVIPEVTDSGIEYNASSPDEKAFVDAARDYDWEFLSRTPEKVLIRNWNSEEVTFDLLALIEFTSARKRMSALVRDAGGQIHLLMKGADSVVMDRLAKDQAGAITKAQAMIDEFAREGLRTMALGAREISEEEYSQWKGGWEAAGVLLEGREEALDRAAVSMEKDLKLVGVTAIEDKLQDNVPETIANLLEADIHVWVLTGDKSETAINIGRSCRMITPAMEPLIMVKGDDLMTVKGIMQKALNVFKEKGTEGMDNENAVVIDGRTMGIVFEDKDARELFARLGISCKTVICCRVSPSQKADIVKLVQGFTNGEVTLSIGDGANDVAMIQAARVGVGISGNEGLQAANSADFSIAQFSFLQKLLFVHGAWNYSRISKVLVYSFYKNLVMVLPQMWFAIYNMWTGNTLYDPTLMIMYNMLFTSLQPFTLGVFDRKETSEDRMSNPKLYLFSQKGLGYNHAVFWRWLRQAVLQSVILFFLPVLALDTGVNNSGGHSEGFMEFGNTIYICVVITATAKAAIEKEAITPMCIFLLVSSVVLWFLVVAVFSYVWQVTSGMMLALMVDAIRILFTNTGFWFCLVTAPALCVALDMINISIDNVAAKYNI